jgi:putative ABC transport system substrate-binding protein
MDRRTFMGTLAGGLLAAPLAAEAQQPARPATIGVLASAEFTEAVRGAIRDGLRDQGYVEGQNIVIEWRSAEGRSDRAAALAVEGFQVLGDDLMEHGVLGGTGSVDRSLEGHGSQVGSRRRPGQC